MHQTEVEKQIFSYIEQFIKRLSDGMADGTELDDPENKIIALIQFREWVKHEINTAKIKEAMMKDK